MKTADDAFHQCYSGQAVVDAKAQVRALTPDSPDLLIKIPQGVRVRCPAS
jgi:hypothetical protein